MISLHMKEALRQAFDSRWKESISDKDLTQAAVLVPILYKEGQYHILFTQRTNQVAYHKGQASFPGGARSESDSSLLDTALRESWEEIGLEAEDAEILGELDDSRTVTSGFIISPFVAFIPYPYKFKASLAEVEETFCVPISALLHEDNGKLKDYLVGDEIVPTYFYEYKGRVIWGATARIVHQFLEVWRSVSGSQR